MYEIPQELKYKEKIVFNLDFQQMGYALLFSFFIILVFKTSIGLYSKLAISSILAVIAVLFMFFDFKLILKNYISWLNFRNIKFLSRKMNRFIGINDIKEEYFETREFKNRLISRIRKRRSYEIKKIAVIRVFPINFNIGTDEEKISITKNFERFLNSLEFPVQIFIKTEDLDISSHYKAIDLKLKKKYRPYFENYKLNLNKITNENKARNRKFYLVIKEAGNLEIQVNICLERLKALNLRAYILKKNSLLKLLKDFFKADEKNAVVDVDRLNYYNYLISPGYIKNNIDYLEIDNKFYRVINAHNYPRAVESGFLDRIITLNGDFDISIFIEPFNIEITIIKINKELQKQRADLYSLEKRKILNTSLKLKYNDTKKTLEELQKGNQKLFNLSLYINARANSKKDLDFLTKKLEAELNSLLIVPKIALFSMHKALKSVMPFSFNEINVTRNITSEALSAFFPFTSQFLDIDKEGVLLGLNKNNIPIIKDIYGLGNSNGFILASSGFGKSFYAKLFVIRQLLKNTKVYVIDPQNEYVNLARKFKGQVINISRNSSSIINPLDLMGHDYYEKRLSLIDLMQVMLGRLSDIQKSVIDKALSLTYERKGIKSDEDTWSYKAPVMADLLKELESMSKKVGMLEKSTYRSLLNRISMYVDGVFSFLNKQTNINFENDFVVFNIGDMPKQVKPVVMFLILDYVYMKMKGSKDKKLLIIDEAWSLLNRVEDASYIFEIVKTSRKFNLALLLITQDVQDLLNSSAGNAVLSNSSYTILLRQKPSVIELIDRMFHLSQNEKDLLMTSSIGNGLVIMDNYHSELKIISSDEEYGLLNTNPNITYRKPRKITKEAREVDIKLDLDKRFYVKKDLSKEEVEFLLNHGYLISSQTSLFNNKNDEYLLKPSPNESSVHFFLIYEISEYIRKFTDEVYTYNTVKPDIVFKINKKEIAIEVETGSNNKKDLMNKVSLLNNNYKEWFFVLSDVNLISQYEKYGKIVLRHGIPTKIPEYFMVNGKKRRK